MHYIDIADARKFFWQWDTGCKLRVTGVEESGQVHFYRDGMTEPFHVPVYKLGEDFLCDIPDEILQIPKKFAAYIYDIDEFGSKTYISKTFMVESRPKPTNYIYTPTEKYDVKQVVKEAIDKIKDGIPSKSIFDVAELPQEDIDTTVLYRTADGVYWYDTKWHKICEGDSESSGQIELAFDGEYDPDKNKVATVQTVVDAIKDLKIDEILHSVDAANESADAAKTAANEATAKAEEAITNITEEESRAKEAESKIRAEIVNADYNENDTSKKSHILNRPFYKNSDRSRYTCDNYKHQAKVEGVINDRFGFATTEIVSLSELGACEIEVECDNQSPDEPSKETRTLSLEDASVRMVAGGYILEVAGFNNCPNARVYVITDASTFNRVCTCDLESNGTYLVITTRDGDYWSYFSTVKAIIKSSVKKLDNMFLDLENNKYFHSVVGDISSAIDAIIAKQTEVLGGES